MPKQKGGKLKAKEVKDFLNASYEKSPPNDLDGYILDKSLSTDTAKVYYNPQTKQAVVAHRGTQGVLDWGNNLAYAVGAYNLTSRYKQGKSVQNKAEKKYGKQNISTLGHSQGAVLARKLGTDTKEVINVNPAYTGERPAKNEYNIRSSTDVVSGLYAPVAKTREMLFPKYSEKHDITVPSHSATDILGEHSYNILDRLGDKDIGVGAGNKISSNSIMYKGGKRYSRLGYSGEDIDWIGGGVITTNNNCGAVGTPYVNKGTNPFGTRGAGRDEESSSSESDDEKGRLVGGADADDGEEEDEFDEQDADEFEDEVDNFADEIEAMNINDNEINQLLDQLYNIQMFLNASGLPHLRGEAIDLMGRIRQLVNQHQNQNQNENQNQNQQSDDEGESDVEGAGRIKNPFKKVGKAFDKVGSTLAKGADVLNPMSYAFKDKGARNAMVQSGEVTHDYLLPAVVSAGKPIYDATAMGASTMLTGNPILGKMVADTLWNEMVGKPGYDPRKNQKSKALGEISGIAGEAVAEPVSASFGGSRDEDRLIRYAQYAETIPPVENSRQLTDKEKDIIRLSSLEIELEQAIEYNDEEYKEQVLREMHALEKKLKNPGAFYGDDDNNFEESEGEIVFGREIPEQDYFVSQTSPTELEEEYNKAIDKAVSNVKEIMKKGKGRITGGSRTILEKLYDIVNPPTSMEDFVQRNRDRRITKAEREEIEALWQVREMRRRADEMERQARATKEQKIKSAMEYGVFEEITPQEAEQETMKAEERLSRKAQPALARQAEIAKQEKQIKKDEPEWSMDGMGRKKNIDFEDIKWGSFTRMFKEFKKENPKARVKDLEAFAHRIIKNKKKFSDKAFKKAQFYLNVIKKGGASREQVGQASIMRTYGEKGTDTFELLSDIVHSADKIDKYNSIYRDLLMRPDAEVAHILKAMEPSFFNQLYYYILNTEDQRNPETQAGLARILKMYPTAKRGIPKGQRWGEDDPVVQQAIAKIQAKRT